MDHHGDAERHVIESASAPGDRRPTTTADQTVLYLHGFLSSAQSTEARFLRQRLEPLPRVTFRALDFNPAPVDFEHMTTTGQIDRLR